MGKALCTNMLTLFIIWKVGISLKIQAGMQFMNFYKFQWEYYAVPKSENKPMMDYYVKKFN